MVFYKLAIYLYSVLFTFALNTIYLRKAASILFLISFQLFGQNPHYFKIDQSKGLPSNSVYDIFQDKEGMMWFGTNDGLCSYDGRKFKSYYCDNQISKSGSNIIQDKYGRIWYCTFDGFIYYLENQQLKKLNQKQNIGFQKFNFLQDCMIYFEKNELVFLDLKTLKKVKSVKINSDLIISFHLFKDILYLFTEDKMYEIISPESIKTQAIPIDLKQNFTGNFLTNTKENLVILSKQANIYYFFKNGKFTKKEVGIKDIYIQNVAYTSKFNWLATTKGILQCDLENPNNGEKLYFKEYNISSIFNDKHGNFWISTLNDGLLLVPDFNTFLIPTASAPSTLTLYKNQICFGTKDEKIMTGFQPDFSQLYQGNSNHNIEQITVDDVTNTIYFSSNSFKELNSKGKIVKDITIAIKDFKKIDNTYYAFASSGLCGLFKFSKEKSQWDAAFEKSYETKTPDRNMCRLIDGVRGKSVAYNPITKSIYFATNIGLFCTKFDKKSEVLFDKKTIYFSKLEYYNNSIYGLTTDNKLLTIDQNNSVTKLDLSKELSEEKVNKIKLLDSDLFLFTANSIFNYDLISQKVTKIFNLNSDNEISDLIKKDNQIILASSKGLILVSNKNSAYPIPKFLLQSVTVNNKIVTLEKLKSLDYANNNIQINFAVITYIPNLKNILYYKINDEKWQLIDDESRSLKLSSLASGDYTISFKTAVENRFSEVQKIKINIQKPIWEHYWFLGIIALLSIGCVIFFYKNQIQKINQRNSILLEKFELEKNLNVSALKAIKSQMNPHFFYNALNTIQSYILANDKKQAVNYLSKFSQLTRTILEMSEKENISLSEETKTMNLYLEIEKARFDDDFEYEISTDKALDLELIKIPSMLLQPYVENAVKHGLLHKKGPKILKIIFEKRHTMLHIEINDNGIGRQKSMALNAIKNKNHNSFATVAMQNRIELLNKNKTEKITINYTDKLNKNQQSLGTNVVIEIPIS